MKYLSVRATAARIGVHENTIRRWEAQGIIPAVRLPGSNFRRFRPEDVDRLATDIGGLEGDIGKIPDAVRGPQRGSIRS